MAKKLSTNYLLDLFQNFLDPAVKPRDVERGSWLIVYLFVFTFCLSGCTKPEQEYIPHPKQLGFIEKTESFVFDNMHQNKIDEFKLFLEDFKNDSLLRVKFYYPSKTPIEFRQKIQHVILKKIIKPKKIDFYKDVYLHNFLKIDLIRYNAILPICPDWSSLVPNTKKYRLKENKKLSNLGCAQQTNLGLMLEDPYDLKESSSLTPGIASEKIEAFNKKNTQSREMENVWSDTKDFSK